MAGPSGAAAKLALATTGNNEDAPQMQLRTGTIIAVDKGTTPWTATLRTSEIDVPGITMLGWYDPVVGDVVQFIQQGPMRFILGICAPGKVYMPASPPPAPPAPPAPPPPPPAIVEKSVTPIGSGTAPAEAPWGGWRSDRLYQGGGGLAQRGFHFYGGGIAAAKGSGTILSGKVFLDRINTSHGSGAGGNVRLGTHGYSSQPGGIPGGHANVSVVGQLNRGEARSFNLPANIIAAMNNGSAVGLGLEPGALGYTSADYIISTGFGGGTEWAGALTLVVQG